MIISQISNWLRTGK